jgi:hypothetical protein
MVNGHALGVTARKRNVPDESTILGVGDVEKMGVPTGFVAAALHLEVLVDGSEHGLIHRRGQLYNVDDLVALSTHQFDPSEVISSVAYDKLVRVGQIRVDPNRTIPADRWLLTKSASAQTGSAEMLSPSGPPRLRRPPLFHPG